MNMKPVELQIAVPRTTEAARVQNELQQRPLLDQQQLAGQQLKSAETAQQRSAEVEESSEPGIRDDGGTGGGSQSGMQSGAEQEEPRLKEAEHPYKGKRFDVSL